MARPRRPGERPSYRAAPTVPADLSDRFEVVSAVIAKSMTMSEGARRLGIARPNLQTLVHRVEAAMIATMTPQPSGRSPRSSREVECEKRLAAAEKANATLTEQLHTMDRLLGAAGEVIRGLRQPSRARSTRSSRSSTPTSTDDEPAPATPTMTPPLEAMMREPVASSLVGRALGCGAATVRRWRCAGGPRPRQPRRRPASPSAEGEVRELVRALKGLPGAAALARAVPAVSRRQAAAIKQEELTAIERERKAATARVEVHVPGVVRGFDAVEARSTAGRRYLLAAGDACVAYRTSIALVERYTGDAVAAALDEDFVEHGAPLVCRLDRAACHRTPAVASVLRRHGVLALHGPPRHPRYYGQLERQNREHRAWLTACGVLAPAALAEEVAAMRTALNTRLLRPTLEWCPTSAVWELRSRPTTDRATLRDEVDDRAARLRVTGLSSDLAGRLAIEHALVARGLMTINNNRRVLCG